MNVSLHNGDYMKISRTAVSVVTSLIALPALAATVETTHTGIPLDTQWKKSIYQYAETNVKHSAWGLAHSERDYQVSIELAKRENIMIDRDVIFAAAFLHDLGAIDPFKDKDIEHSIRSVELVEPILAESGFPMQKWPQVKAAILGHMYYAERPTENEAIVFHDADTLDFLGVIGITRLVSITERHRWAETLAGAFATLRQFKNEFPSKLVTESARQLAAQRIQEIEQFEVMLSQETFAGAAL